MTMEAEPRQKASFFDSENLRNLFCFVKPEKVHQIDLETPAIIVDTLIKQSHKTSVLSEPGCYALHKNLLVHHPVGDITTFCLLSSYQGSRKQN